MKFLGKILSNNSVQNGRPCSLRQPLNNSLLIDRNVIFTSSLSNLAINIYSKNNIFIYIDGAPNIRVGNDVSTNNPAEAIYNVYKNYPTDIFSKIYGVFTIIIIDLENNLTLIAIDRIGVNNVSYHIHKDNSLTFGTDNFLVANNLNSYPNIAKQAIYEYFYHHVIPSPNTIFTGVKKLLPGSYIKLQNDELTINKYWKPEFHNTTDRKLSGLTDQLFNTLEGAISKFNINEKTGCFLSGGLDSSSILGHASKLSTTPIKAFNISFKSAGDFDESYYAELAAKHFNAQLISKEITPEDLVNVIPIITAQYDQPFGNSSAIPTYLCAKLAKDHGCDLLLAGDGGDELFAGNTRYSKQLLFEKYYQIPPFIRNKFLNPLSGNRTLNAISPFRKLQRYIEQATIPLPKRLFTYSFLELHDDSEIFDQNFLDKIDRNLLYENMKNDYVSNITENSLNNLLLFDWKLTLFDNDLKKVSEMCSAAEISVGYPMLDDDLIKFSCEVPNEIKLYKNRLRHFFKEAYKDFLPNEIIKKKKHGFGLPFGRWMLENKGLNNFINDYLNDFKKRGIINPVYIERILYLLRTDNSDYYSTFLWLVVILEAWLQHHKIKL